MTEMLFGNYENEFMEYDGEDFSDTIGDQWKCDCTEECENCPCQEGV